MIGVGELGVGQVHISAGKEVGDGRFFGAGDGGAGRGELHFQKFVAGHVEGLNGFADGLDGDVAEEAGELGLVVEGHFLGPGNVDGRAFFALDLGGLDKREGAGAGDFDGVVAGDLAGFLIEENLLAFDAVVAHGNDDGLGDGVGLVEAGVAEEGGFAGAGVGEHGLGGGDDGLIGACGLEDFEFDFHAV